MTEAILMVADRTPELKDSAVLSALRAIATEGQPASEFAKQLSAEIATQLDREQVGAKDRRRAATDLIKLLPAKLDPDVPDQLIKYLSLLA